MVAGGGERRGEVRRFGKWNLLQVLTSSQCRSLPSGPSDGLDSHNSHSIKQTSHGQPVASHKD